MTAALMQVPMCSTLFYLSLLIPCSNSQYVSGICSTANDELNAANSELGLSALAMYDTYNKTCFDAGTCDYSSSTSDKTTVTRNYAAVKNNEEYRNMEEACGTLGDEFTLCVVGNVVDNDLMLMAEVGKPICVPASCDVNNVEHVRILDPSPFCGWEDVGGGNEEEEDCGIFQILFNLMFNMFRQGQRQKLPRNSSSKACNIIDTVASCPSDTTSSNIDQCRTDAARIEDNSAYTSARRKLNFDMVTHCLGVLFDNNDSINIADKPCYILAKILVTSNQDFTGFEAEDVFTDFLVKCLSAGGSICRASIDRESTATESFLQLDTSFSFINYPFCLARECLDTDTDTDIGAEVIDSRYPCEDTCEFNVKEFGCA